MNATRMRPWPVSHADIGYVGVLTNTWMSRDFIRQEIEAELAARQYTGYVLFDYVLATGRFRKRFQREWFDGERLVVRSRVVVRRPPDEVLRVIASFFEWHCNRVSVENLSALGRMRLRHSLGLCRTANEKLELVLRRWS